MTYKGKRWLNFTIRNFIIETVYEPRQRPNEKDKSVSRETVTSRQVDKGLLRLREEVLEKKNFKKSPNEGVNEMS